MNDRSTSLIARVPAWAARRPGWVIGGVVVLTALALWVVPGLRLQTGIYELFPRREGPIRALSSYGRLFGARQEVVVLVSGSDPGRVAQATRLAAAELSRSKLVAGVSSGVQGTAMTSSLGRSLLLLAGPQAWPRMRARLEQMKPHVARLRRVLLSPVTPSREVLTSDPLGLSELLLRREGAAQVDQDSGLFAAPGGKAALIMVRPVRGPSDLEFCRQLVDAFEVVRGRVERANDGQVKLAFTGGYHYALHIAAALQRDLTLSGVAALVGVVLFMLLFFRSLRLVPLAVLVSGIAVLWTLALAAVSVGGLNALSMAFAALCVGMGLDGLIHLTARTRSFSDAASPPQEAQRALAPALLAAALTTVAAFLTFTASAFDGLAHTGLLAAIGLGLTLLMTLLLVPALGSLSSWLALPVQRVGSRRSWIDWLLGGLAGAVTRGRWFVLLGTLLVAVASLLSARGLHFSADLTALAPATIPPARTDREIARQFQRGRYGMVVMLRGAEQRALRVNDKLAQTLRRWQQERRIAGFRSIAGLLPARQTQRQRRARLAALDPPALAARLAGELEAVGLEAAAFKPFTLALTDPRELAPADLPDALTPLIRRHLARESGTTVVSTIVHPRAGATAVQQRQLADALRSALAPLDRTVAVEVTGAAVAGLQMAELLRRDLLLISVLSLALVLLVLALLLRRLRQVAAAVLSLLLTGLAFVGALSALGLPIDLYSLMVLPVLIGYGVDDHIYVVRRALTDGVRTAVVESGRAVLATTLTSMAAFGALALCQVPGLRTLGLTSILGLGLGLLGSLVVMPALLSLGDRGAKTR